MRSDELQKILQSDDCLTLDEIKNIIYELKNDCVMFKEDRYEAGFYNGEMNAFYICLDLLDKMDLSVISNKMGKASNSVKELCEALDFADCLQHNNIYSINYQRALVLVALGYNRRRISNYGTVKCCTCERDEIICKEEGKCMKEIENA